MEDVYRPMKPRAWLTELLQWPRLNFIVTNLLPRRSLTLLVGRISKSEHPWIRYVSMALWRYFSDVDLSDASTTEFRSMHACFTRALRPGARAVDLDPCHVTSPCDAIVGAHGRIDGQTLLQAKQITYTLTELLGDEALARRLENGCYVTLRLTAGMYHRFHAPLDGVAHRVRYFSGDVWNVNQPTLDRVAKLFCKNERAVIELTDSSTGTPLVLVPVAAILVASIRLHFADLNLHLRYAGPQVVDCDAACKKGAELGWFEHGSTIIVLAPQGCSLLDDIRQGQTIRMGRALLRLPTV